MSKKEIEIIVEYDPTTDANLYRDFGEDLFEYEHTKNKLKKFLPVDVYAAMENDDQNKQELLETFLNEFSKKNKNIINKAMKKAESVIEKHKEETLDELGNLYEVLPNCAEISMVLITMPMYPYNSQYCWFACPLFGTKEEILQTMKHELNHFFFHKKFDSPNLPISKEKYFDIKESFSILTLPNERGYPGHEKLREFILNSHREGKSVNEIFEKCIKKVNS